LSLVVVSLGLVGSVFLMLEPLMTMLAGQLPEIKREIQHWIVILSELMRGVETISQEIEDTVGGTAQADAGAAIPSIMDALWLAPNFGAQLFIFIGTLFFFVLTREDVYAAAHRFQTRLHSADRAVARYFLAVTIVNAGLGMAAAGVLALIGVNNALLWGFTAAVLNFILYLGPMTIIAGLLVAGLTQFTGMMVLLPPLAFLTLNIIEAQFVTPAFVGQRLQLNPLAIFLAIVFGLWLWGPVGAIVSLPVVLWFGVMVNPQMVQPAKDVATRVRQA
jgi:predicted PurR-regulated permease PerM